MATAQRKIAKVEGGEERARAYWRKNVRLILSLLAIWALVSYGAAVALAQPLAGLQIGRVSLSFWFAHQGAIVVFVILIFVYAAMMDRIDSEFDVHEGEM